MKNDICPRCKQDGLQRLYNGLEAWYKCKYCLFIEKQTKIEQFHKTLPNYKLTTEK